MLYVIVLYDVCYTWDEQMQVLNGFRVRNYETSNEKPHLFQLSRHTF